MKRQISPTKIRIPSHPGSHRIRSSDSTDISSKKRIKFTDPQDGENHRPHRPPRCEIADNAKTSEYAFFKRWKHGGRDKSKNSESRECSRERINVVRNRSEGTRSSLLNENATPELSMKRACAALEDVHGKQHDNVEEYESALRTNGKRLACFEETETENKHADIFDRKRQKLHQWVAHTSFPEIGELCSKGYDCVSVLLSRLIPKSNENNKFKDPDLMQVETNDKSISLPSYESDIHFRKLQSTPARNFMELECGPCLHDTMLSCWSKRPRERILCSNTPTSYAYENRLQCRIWEPDPELLGGSAISRAESDSHYIFPFDYVKEIDVFCQPNEYLVERQLHVPMLGWDFDSTKEDGNLSNLSRYGAEHTSTPLAGYHNHDVRSCLEGNSIMQSGFQQIPLTLSCIPNFSNLHGEDCINDTVYEVGSTMFSLRNDQSFKRKIVDERHYLPNTESLLSSQFDSRLGCKYLEFSGSTSHALEPEQKDIYSHLLTYGDDMYERSLEEYSSHRRSITHFIEDDISTHDSSAFCPQI